MVTSPSPLMSTVSECVLAGRVKKTAETRGLALVMRKSNGLRIWPLAAPPHCRKYVVPLVGTAVSRTVEP